MEEQKMKEIVFAKINRYELATILFAAKWQIKDWNDKNNEYEINTNELWESSLKAIKYLENYMKDYPKQSYYLQTMEHEI